MQVSELKQSMESHLKDRQRGEITRDGLRIAIIGPPNAGKSTLLNFLAKRDVAIVSDIAGTTRDVVEVALDLGGVKCIISDTAGLREHTDDIIEVEGMKRARSAAQKAHFNICVLDSSDAVAGLDAIKSIITGDGDDDEETLLDSKNMILVANKIDLVTTNGSESITGDSISSSSHTSVLLDVLGLSKAETERINITTSNVYGVSCVENVGMTQLLRDLQDKVLDRVGGVDESLEEEGSAIITRERHRKHVTQAVEALDKFIVLSQEGSMAIDLAAEELRLATSELGRIVGAIDVEDVLDVLFADFCIGK